MKYQLGDSSYVGLGETVYYLVGDSLDLQEEDCIECVVLTEEVIKKHGIHGDAVSDVVFLFTLFSSWARADAYRRFWVHRYCEECDIADDGAMGLKLFKG